MDYSDLPLIEEYDVTCARNYGQSQWIDPALREKLLAETSWRFLEPTPGASSPEQSEAIGLRKIDCPWCGWKPTDLYAGNKGRRIPLAIEGKTTGAQIRRNFPCS